MVRASGAVRDAPTASILSSLIRISPGESVSPETVWTMALRNKIVSAEAPTANRNNQSRKHAGQIPEKTLVLAATMQLENCLALTLSLSPGRGDTLLPHWKKSPHDVASAAMENRLPLPGGEGRGEGGTFLLLNRSVIEWRARGVVIARSCLFIVEAMADAAIIFMFQGAAEEPVLPRTALAA